MAVANKKKIEIQETNLLRSEFTRLNCFSALSQLAWKL